MLQRNNGVGVVRVGVLALAVLAGCTGRTDGEDTSSSSSGTPASSSSSGVVGSSSRAASSSRASSGVSGSGGSSSRVSSSVGQSSSAPATSQPASSTSTTGSGTSTAASGTSTAGSGSSTAGSTSVGTSSSLAQSSSDTGASGSGGASSVGGSSSVDMSSSGGVSSSGGLSSSGGPSSSGGSSSSSGGGGAVCGNGVPEGLEQCDDGNMVENDDCTNGCLIADCGDGIVNDLGINPVLVEECDDANTIQTDGCTNACATARCGDGFLYALNENCDDGNGDNTDGCPDLAPTMPDGRTYCQPARCGDGFVQGGVEGCDDGNGVNTDACPDGTGAFCTPAFCGDGFVQQGAEQCDTSGVPTAQCDAMCYLLPRRFIEIEPNNTQMTANAIGTFMRVEGGIPTAGDADWFAFTVTQVVHLTATISNPAGACTGNYDTYLTLADQNGVSLAEDDDISGSTNRCSELTPAANTGARSLVPGRTYYLVVEHFSTTGTLSSPYQLDLVFTPNTCGDAYVGGTEQCDGVPGCNASCQTVCGDGIVVAPIETCDGMPLPAGCSPTTCTPVCGDGILLAPEQCDPPATGTCSSTCRFEYPSEVEPNGSLTAPDVPNPLAAPGVLAALPPMDVDYFTFTLTAVSHVRLETTGLAGTCPAGADTLMQLLAADGTTIIGSDDNDGDGNCSLIRPQVDTFARALPAGVYYVRVTATADLPQYLLTVQINANVCGDGFLAEAEICDDGNTTAGDGCVACAPVCGDGIRVGPETCEGMPLPAGCNPTNCQPVCGDSIVLAPEQCDPAGATCSATCTFIYPSEGAALNNTTAQADSNPFLAVPGITGSVEPETDVDIYRLEITVPGTSIRIYTEESQDACPNADTQLRLLNAAGTSLVTDYDDGRGFCSYIGIGPGPDGSTSNDAAATNMAAGTYYVEVTSEVFLGAQDPIPAYTLRVEIILPFCGNGVTNPGEACDDGNTIDTDSCRNDCTLNLVLTPEVEPNSDRADALGNGALPMGSNGWSAVINGPTALPTPGPGDQDWFLFTVPAGATVNVRAEVSDGATVCPFDSFLELRSAGNLLLASDGDDGIGTCSLIDPATDVGARSLTGGPMGTNYFFMVRHNSTTNTFTGPYVLKVTFSMPACGNTIVEAGEQCDDGNMTTGDGCDACTFELGYSGEAEMNGACASTSSGIGNTCTPAEVGASTPVANLMTFDATGNGRMDGSITPAGDDDWFAFDVVTAGPVVIRTGPVIGTTCPGDTTMDIFTATGTVALAQDDDDGVGLCSFLGSGVGPEGNGGADAAMASLAVGRYYVRVHGYSSSTTITAYRLTVTRAP